MTYYNKIIQRGLTMVEAAMVLAIGTIVVAGIMIFYQSASMNSKTNETLTQISDLNSTIKKIYVTAPNYSTLTNSAMINANVLPRKMVSNNNIYHAFNSTISLAPTSHNGGTNNAYFVTLNNLPSEACSKIILSDMGRSLVEVRVNTTNLTLPVRPSDTIRCGNSNATVRLKFQ